MNSKPSRIFTVTGLPRSRTAWLSNLLTVLPSSLCFHEPERRVESLRDLAGNLEKIAPFAKHIGISSSGIPLQFSEFNELFPEAIYVVVIRDLRQASESYKKAFPFIAPDRVDELMRKCSEGIDEIVGRIPFNRLKTVSYDRLNEVTACEQVHDFCIPDVMFNYTRCRMLQTMKVEMIWDKAYAEAHHVHQAAADSLVKGAAQ